MTSRPPASPRPRSRTPLALIAAALALAAPATHLAAAGWLEPAPIDVPGPRPEALATDAAAFRQHTTTLASPFFEGRAPGTRGNQLAADYLEFYFKRLGLKPAFPLQSEQEIASETKTDQAPASDDADKAKSPEEFQKEVEKQAAAAAAAATPGTAHGEKPFSSYRQPFPFGTNISMKDSAVTISGGLSATLEPERDYSVLGFSGDAEATGPLVYIGYGINIGKDGYSSFPANADLTGKIAVVLRFEPMNDAGKSQWDDEGWSYNAALEPKIQQAAKRGAAGVILVSAPGADDPRANKLETLDNTKPAGKGLSIPVVMLSIDQADRLVKAADPQGRSLMDLRKLADDLATVTEKGSVVDLPGATVTLKTKVTREPIITSNIGAVLPGAGSLADQYVVIGAHYDHVGYGLFGSRGGPADRGKIHAGADDNASGTSGMLILAQKLTDAYAAMPADQPRRSILFMGFTAEESGLIGSRHYTQHMIAPKDKHAIMINLDMIGRYRGDDEKQPPLELGGVATAKGLEDFLKPMMDSSGLRIAPKPGGYGPSDHASFFGAGIPVLFFFTGLHEQYHAPSDTPDTLNPEGAARIVSLVQQIALAAATRPENFEYNGDAESAQSAATGDAPARPRVRVRFGITPGDYAGEDGVLVGEVSEGGSAAEAGVQKGDRMIKWGDQPLTTVQSWMPLLSNHRPGDKVDIVVVRDGKEVTLTVTLKGRRDGSQ